MSADTALSRGGEAGGRFARSRASARLTWLFVNPRRTYELDH